MKNRVRVLFVILAASIAAPPVLSQQYQPLLDGKRRDLLHEVLSGERAKDFTIAITRHHRVQGSRGYRAAAQYVLQQLHAFGFGEEEAYIESFPSDGKVEYQTWQSPSGWDIEAAELRILEPYEERIAGFPEVAMHVITYSNPGDLTAELVWVGAGTRDNDYQGKDVRGKRDGSRGSAWSLFIWTSRSLASADRPSRRRKWCWSHTSTIPRNLLMTMRADPP